MYNKAKFLTSKIAGLVALTFGGISILLSVLAALTFTYSCSGENITMTFPKLLYIGLIVAKCVFEVSIIRKGIACVKEPMKVLMNEDALTGLKYKWKCRQIKSKHLPLPPERGIFNLRQNPFRAVFLRVVQFLK